MIDFVLGLALALGLGSLVYFTNRKPTSSAAPPIETPPGGFVCQCGDGFSLGVVILGAVTALSLRLAVEVWR